MTRAPDETGRTLKLNHRRRVDAFDTRANSLKAITPYHTLLLEMLEVIFDAIGRDTLWAYQDVHMTYGA